MKLKPADWLMLPLCLLAVVLIYVAFSQYDSPPPNLIFMLIAAVILLAVVFVLSPQINWFFFRRNPPLATKSEMQRVQDMPYFVGLSTENKVNFGKRLALFCIGNDFMRPAPPNEDNRVRRDVPSEIKGILGASAVQLTFGFDSVESAMMGKFENFIIYPHPFVSPQQPDVYHFSETFEPDGVMLFSADELTRGAIKPTEFFNIGLYELAKNLPTIRPDLRFPTLTTPQIYTDLAKIGWGGFEAAASLNNMSPDPFALAVVNFFAFPEKMKAELPDLFQLLQNLLHQNSTAPQNPRTKA